MSMEVGHILGTLAPLEGSRSVFVGHTRPILRHFIDGKELISQRSRQNRHNRRDLPQKCRKPLLKSSSDSNVGRDASALEIRISPSCGGCAVALTVRAMSAIAERPSQRLTDGIRENKSLSNSITVKSEKTSGGRNLVFVLAANDT